MTNQEFITAIGIAYKLWQNGKYNNDVYETKMDDLLSRYDDSDKNSVINGIISESDKGENGVCDTCKSGLIDYPEINRRTCRCGRMGYNVTDER